MKEEELKARTKNFALRVINLVNALPRNTVGLVIGKQLLRAGTSAAANYRSACRARSTADFISKLGIVIEEADESAFWLELVIESKLLKANLVEPLLKETKETNEIIAIMVSAKNTTSKNLKSKNLKS